MGPSSVKRAWCITIFSLTCMVSERVDARHIGVELPQHARFYEGREETLASVFRSLVQWLTISEQCRRALKSDCLADRDLSNTDINQSLKSALSIHVFDPMYPIEHLRSPDDYSDSATESRQRFMRELFSFEKQFLSRQRAVENVCSNGERSRRVWVYRDFDLLRYWRVNEGENEISTTEIELGADRIAASLKEDDMTTECDALVRFGRHLMKLLQGKLLPYAEPNWPDITDEQRTRQAISFVLQVAAYYDATARNASARSKG